ncbi:MAG TPA: acyloxyacyl hydrolase [Thermoanaerobaculia bacterium]|nr:acyloxyacyl hydrolase [Thermoanaerobaculia bacterium]
MRLRHSSLALIVLALLGGASLQAQGGDGGGWSASLGVIDFTRSNEALELGIAHRWPEWWWGLRPVAGVHLTADESYFGYLGLRRSFRLGGGRWSFEPSLAVSLYEDGDGKDLGGPVEFRSGADFLYALPMGGKVGIGFYHLSNSGLYDKNPGANSLLLRYLLPNRFR